MHWGAAAVGLVLIGAVLAVRLALESWFDKRLNYWVLKRDNETAKRRR